MDMKKILLITFLILTLSIIAIAGEKYANPITFLPSTFDSLSAPDTRCFGNVYKLNSPSLTVLNVTLGANDESTNLRIDNYEAFPSPVFIYANVTNRQVNWSYGVVNLTNANRWIICTDCNGSACRHATKASFALPFNGTNLNVTLNIIEGDAPTTDGLKGIESITTAEILQVPDVIIKFPLNISYNYVITSMNYTIINTTALSSCWFFNGTANNTINCGTNITGNLSANQGTNTWLMFVNDSKNTLNITGVTFFVNSNIPSSIANFTTPNPVVQGAFFNWTVFVNDSQLQNITNTSFTVKSPNGTIYNYLDDVGIMNGNQIYSKNFSIYNILISSSTGHNGMWTLNATSTTNNTLLQQVNTFYKFTINDIIKPRIDIITPVNNSLDRLRPTQFNFSVGDEVEVGSCWYYNNTANTTINNCNNFTLTLIAGNNYNFTFFVNDTSNNVNSSYVNFTVYNDTTNPSVIITQPTGTKTSRTVIASFNVSDDNFIDYCFYNVTTSADLPIISNTRITNCQNNLSVIFNTGADYSNAKFNLWANDTYGNFNNSQSIFTVDTSSVIPPSGGGGGGNTPSCNSSVKVLYGYSSSNEIDYSASLNGDERPNEFITIQNNELDEIKINGVSIESKDGSDSWITLGTLPQTITAKSSEQIKYGIKIPKTSNSTTYTSIVYVSITTKSCTNKLPFVIKVEVSPAGFLGTFFSNPLNILLLLLIIAVASAGGYMLFNKLFNKSGTATALTLLLLAIIIYFSFTYIPLLTKAIS